MLTNRVDLTPDVTIDPDSAVLRLGDVEVTIARRPFGIDVRRGRGRRLVRGVRPWAVDGSAADVFMHFTEGVIAQEELADREWLNRARTLDEIPGGVRVGTRFSGGRGLELDILLKRGELSLEMRADGEPFRLGVDWEARTGEHFTGLGARHGLALDQSGRRVRLGADRRYTGPDCPPDMLDMGGIPQGDYAPMPWVLASRGYGLWLETGGDGSLFALGPTMSVSARGAAGPFRLHLLTGATPIAQLRELARATGFPALLPEWGYGYWKSRDFYEHQSEVEDDFEGFERHGLPLDAVVLDSPWETQYNTWRFNPHQFPDPAGLITRMRAAGVRTVVWITPWVNEESVDGQQPADAESDRLHREPAENYAEGAELGHFVKTADGEPFVAPWWMGTGSLVDFTSPAADDWWRELARPVLELGVQGIKADDGEGYYFPPDVRLADGRTGAEAGWAHGRLYRDSMQRALDDAHPGQGVVFGRSGWTGQQSTGILWGGDQASDWWSLRALVTATLTAAASGYSNWSHDIGGYLGEKLIERCPKELLLRWVQFGCFTPLMHAHARFEQEPWTYDDETLDLYRQFILLHERLVPYVRAAADLAARSGLPITRPLCLADPADPRGWELSDAYGYGPSLWVAPVLERGAQEREVPLPRGSWIDWWSGDHVTGGGEVVAPAPLERIPLWVRSGSLIVTYPEEHVAAGLGDVPEGERPIEATLWGEPPCGRAMARLADGTRVRWDHGCWSVTPERPVSYLERP